MGTTTKPEPRPASGLGSSLQEFCRTSSAHGLGHLPDSAGHARYLWLAIVLVLLAALLYNVGVSLHREAFTQPVRTENTWHMSRDPLPLPRTTVCDLSVFRQPRLDARNVSGEMASYLAAALGGRAFTAPDFLGDTDRQARLKSEYECLLRPGESHTELIDSLSPSCEEVFAQCYFRGQTMSGAQCCRDLITPVHTVRGKCYQVADTVQKRGGKMYGMLFLLSLPTSEFPTLDRTVVDGCLNTRLGAEVLLDDPARLPHTRVVSHSVAMSPPGAMELRVTIGTIDRTGLLESVFPPLHRCASGNDSAPLESVDNCPVLRLAEQIRAVCGCHWLSMPSAADADGAPPLPVCSPQQVFRCVLPLQASPLANDCPPACRESAYTPAAISARLSPAMDTVIGAQLNVTSDARLSMRVYLETLQYRMVRQWCQTGSELLAELGGHMGIFLGVSVVTICEALAALAGCLTGGCRRRRATASNDGSGNDGSGDGGSGGKGNTIYEWYQAQTRKTEAAKHPQAWLDKDQTLSITIRRSAVPDNRPTRQPSNGESAN